MAKFNGNIYGKQYANDETENKKCAVFLQECLTNEEYELLKADYDKTDKLKEWWKFVFDNVEVSYKGLK